MSDKNLYQDMLFPFVQVSEKNEFSRVLHFLEDRMPQSCFVSNAVKMAPRFPTRSFIYYANFFNTNVKEVCDNSWIIVIHRTEDHGPLILICPPPPDKIINEKERQDIKEAFSSCKLFEWDKSYWILGTDSFTSRIMIEISVEDKGNSVEIYPDRLFYMEKNAPQLNTDFGSRDEEIEVRSLTSDEETTSYIAQTWSWSTPLTSSNLRSILPVSESGAVYKRGVALPLSSVIVNGIGFQSKLYTKEEERGKGYAKMGVIHAAKEMIKSGLLPVTSAESWNKASIRFHQKLGFKEAGIVQYIIFKEQ